jgi:hypothetical protein
MCGARRVHGHLFHVIEQSAFRGRESGFIELALEYRGNTLVGGSLYTQEVRVRVQSIRAPVEVGDVAGDHFLLAALEMPFGEMDGI